MKKWIAFCLLLVSILAMPLSAAAVSASADVNSQTVFHTDGSCQVTLTLQLSLTGEESVLEYPLPLTAQQITIGTQTVQTREDGEQIWVTLPVSGAGVHTLQLHYELKGLLTWEKKLCYLTLPILSGFHYPIEHLEFAITFPDELAARPILESGYYQQDVNQVLEHHFDGTSLTGKSKVALKDRETLIMTVQVPDGYFREAPRQFQPPDGWDLVMILLIGVSVLYFLLTLMPKFPGSARRTTVPDEIHAGDVGTCLTGCGTDLTMLVLTWAQLGYITIELDRKNCVTLHKRMEMGNERSGYEARWFKVLFGQHTMIDGDSYHYAKLCRKLATKSPLQQQLYHRRSGNPLLFLCF